MTKELYYTDVNGWPTDSAKLEELVVVGDFIHKQV